LSLVRSLFSFFILRPLPRSTLFPYTTLFRSDGFWAGAGCCTGSCHCRQVCTQSQVAVGFVAGCHRWGRVDGLWRTPVSWLQYRRSEEHTSELQSRENLVCRLLLEKKKKYIYS